MSEENQRSESSTHIVHYLVNNEQNNRTTRTHGKKKKNGQSQRYLRRVTTCATRASLPALVTADHVAVIVGEATDAAGYVSPVAAILGGAERGAPGRFVLAPWYKQPSLSLSDQHGGGRGGRRRRWGPRPIVMVLMEAHKGHEVQVNHSFYKKNEFPIFFFIIN